MNDAQFPMEFPDVWRDLHRLPAEPADHDLPRELAKIGIAVTDGRDQKRKLHGLKKADLRKADLSENLSGQRMPWSDLAHRPRIQKQSVPMEIVRQGKRLDPLHIIQPDNRSTYFDLSYPWCCVCRVITANGATGSGVLIGPRHVLTASHCIDWTTDRAELVEVHRNGTFVAAASFDTNVLAYTQITGGPTSSTLDEDYAVMVLGDRLGDRFGYLGCRTYDSSWDEDGYWATIGYPTDFGGMLPTFQGGVYLDEDAFDYGGGRAMTTNADLKPGQSGSAFFSRFGSDFQAVAVVSSESDSWPSGKQNWCSGGFDLTRLVAKARSDFP